MLATGYQKTVWLVTVNGTYYVFKTSSRDGARVRKRNTSIDPRTSRQAHLREVHAPPCAPGGWGRGAGCIGGPPHPTCHADGMGNRGFVVFHFLSFPSLLLTVPPPPPPHCTYRVSADRLHPPIPREEQRDEGVWCEAKPGQQ